MSLRTSKIYQIYGNLTMNQQEQFQINWSNWSKLYFEKYPNSSISEVPIQLDLSSRILFVKSLVLAYHLEEVDFDRSFPGNFVLLNFWKGIQKISTGDVQLLLSYTINNLHKTCIFAKQIYIELCFSYLDHQPNQTICAACLVPQYPEC